MKKKRILKLDLNKTTICKINSKKVNHILGGENPSIGCDGKTTSTTLPTTNPLCDPSIGNC